MLNRTKSYRTRMGAVLLAAVLCVPFFQIPAQAYLRDSMGGIYAFHIGSNCLNVQYAGGVGANIVTDPFNAEKNELWLVRTAGGLNNIQLSPLHAPNLYLSAPARKGQGVTLSRDVLSDATVWHIEYNSDGTVNLKNMETGYVLDCKDGKSDTVGTQFLTWDQNGFAAAQAFTMSRLSTNTSTDALNIGSKVNLDETTVSIRIDSDRSKGWNITFGSKAPDGSARVAVDPINQVPEEHEVFQVVRRSDGVVSFHPYHDTSLCVVPSGVAVDAPLTLKKYNANDTSCCWEVYKNGGGYSFRNVKTKLFADNTCCRSHDGNPIISYTDNRGCSAQVFYIQKEDMGLRSPIADGYTFRKASYDLGMLVRHDIPCPTGTLLYAIDNGTITYHEAKDANGNYKSYGKYIKFTSENGKYTAIYAHLSTFMGRVGKEYEVQKGEPIGRTGSTGNSTGPHLHFELRRSGSRIDPTIEFPELK